MKRNRLLAALLAAFLTVAVVSCGGDDPQFETTLDVDELALGDVIALRPADEGVEYISRRAGEIYLHRTGDIDLSNGGSNPELITSIPVSIEGEQRGLLGHTVVDGRRFAAWTDIDSLDLVVGEVDDAGVERIIWAGTGTQSTAIGGHLDARNGLLVLGLGSLTDWSKEHGSGALVTLDPDGDADQQPVVISDGWNNPFAFIVTDTGWIWVADNSPDGSDLPVEERAPERIASGIQTGDGDGPILLEPPPQRAPSAIVELPDGRLGVCGFLDNEMRAYEIVEGEGEGEAVIERAGTIGPCLTGAATLPDSSIVTASTADDGDSALLIRTP